jgi:alkylated DNA repair protein alkB family protein 6
MQCLDSWIFQWLDTYGKKIAALGLFDGKLPNHVLVNEDLPGQGIMVSMG